MATNDPKTTAEALAQAEEAYRKFSDIMAGLSLRQKEIVERAIKKIEQQQIDKLRKKLNLN
jgi:mevalonate kinase